MLKINRKFARLPWLFGSNRMHSLFFSYSEHYIDIGLIHVCNLYRTYNIAFQQKQDQ